MPVPRRSRGARGRRAGTRPRRARRAGRRPTRGRATPPGRGPARGARPRRTRARRARRSRAAAHGAAWRRTSFGETEPFQRSISSRTAASAGSPSPTGSESPAPKATQRERAPPALSVNATWRPSPSALRVGHRRRRDEQRDGRVAHAERRELLELLGQVERQRVALRDGVDPDLGHEVLVGQSTAFGVLEERRAERVDLRRARSSGPPPPCGRRSGAGARRSRAGRRAGRTP